MQRTNEGHAEAELHIELSTPTVAEKTHSQFRLRRGEKKQCDCQVVAAVSNETAPADAAGGTELTEIPPAKRAAPLMRPDVAPEVVVSELKAREIAEAVRHLVCDAKERTAHLGTCKWHTRLLGRCKLSCILQCRFAVSTEAFSATSSGPESSAKRANDSAATSVTSSVATIAATIGNLRYCTDPWVPSG